MQDKIEEFVRRNQDATFPELMAAIPHSCGDQAIFLKYDTLLLWPHVSQEFKEALEALLAAGKIHLRRDTPKEAIMNLAFTGTSVPCSRIARKIWNYKKPHWLPVTIRPGRGEA